MDMRKDLPKIPHAFFKWYCQQEKYEELHGDLEEFYHDRVGEVGVTKARLHYLLDVIRCCQPYAWKKSRKENSTITTMVRNYYKTSFRNLMKNPVSSFINIFGLSVAIGICLVVHVFLQYDRDTDQFHENKNSVYLTTFLVDRDGSREQYGTSPTPLGQMLEEDFGKIQKVCRIEDRNVVLKHDDHVFHEQVRYTDPEFLELLTFPLKSGTVGSLEDLNSIILSEDMALKYFGNDNPLGQDMLMILGENQSKVFKVAGVAEAFPKSRTIDFDFLLNFDNLMTLDAAFDPHDWESFISATMIQVEDPADLEQIEQGMEKYRLLQNEAQNDWAIEAFAFEKLVDLHYRSGQIRDDISFDSNAEARVGLPIIAAFMLLLACFNYINIAIVSATKRLKEIGLRKVIGASKTGVIFQFLVENIFFTVFALLVGFVLAVTIFVPWFSSLTGDPLAFRWIDVNLWIFLISIVLITGIISGIYPAFYISKFEPVKIFKGSLQFGKKNMLTKAFLGVQLIMTCGGITCAVIFTQNNVYQNNKSWGYNQNHVLYLKLHDSTAFDRLKVVMEQDPGVVSIAGSTHHLGESNTTAVIHMPGRQYEVDQLSVGTNYFETMEIELSAGRFFKDQHESDKKAIVVNELLVKNLGLDQPLGQQFEIDSAKYEVIGVVKNFHTYNFYNKLRPTIFKVASDADYKYMSLRVNSGSERDLYVTLRKQWASLFPEIPFQGGHQEDTWARFFVQLDTAEKFYKVLAFLAVMLASLGLYGLVRLNVSGRVREFSIRKVLGAGIKDLAASVIKQYATLCAVSLIIGIPFSYFLAKASLDMLYAYPMPVTWGAITLAMLILIMVLLAVISTQIEKVLRSNPVEGLKIE